MKKRIFIILLALASSGFVASCTAENSDNSESMAVLLLLQNQTETVAPSIYGTWTTGAGTSFETTLSVSETTWGTANLEEYDQEQQTVYILYPGYTYDNVDYPASYSRIKVHFETKNLAYYCTETYGHASLSDAKDDTTTYSFVDESTANCGTFTWTKMERSAE